MPKRFSLPPGWLQARRYHLLAPLVALGFVWIFEQTWIAQLVEFQTVSLRFRTRAPYDPPADYRLIFVGIDQQSLDILGRYPWPRTTIADFLTNLAKSNAGPNCVAFDVLYTEKALNPADDQALGDATSLLDVVTGALKVDPDTVTHDKNREVIADAEAKSRVEMRTPGPTAPFTHVNGDVHRIKGSNIATLPVEPVRTQSFFGFVNDEPSNIDYVRHKLPMVIRFNDQIYPSLALQTLCQTLGVDPDKVVVNVGCNVVLTNFEGKSWTIPIEEDGEYLINYRQNSSFQSVSFGLLDEYLQRQVINGTPLPSKIPKLAKTTLLVGEAATSLTDLGPTPMTAQSPLPYVHLNVMNNVLQNDYLRVVPWYWVVLGWCLVTWPTLLRLKEAPLIEAVLMPIVIVMFYVIIAFGIFFWSVQIELAWPVLSYGVVNFWGVVLRWREEQKGRLQLRAVFAQMVSPDIMNHLLKHPENMKLGGSDRASTILFSDIRDYTKFSEGKTASEVMGQLNVYFERMVACVFESKGSLHKFIGDAVMAAWGDIPEASQGPAVDAHNAVKSALMMRRRLRILNEERQANGLTPIRIGVGLNHGVVQAGMLGSQERKEFTMIGDEVNVASRLEGITKEFHTDIAISESVRRLLGSAFLVRRLGFIQLKGKTKPTLVFEVQSEKTNPADAKMTPEGIARYETAFNHLLARRFAEAEKAFAACQLEYPDDYCINQYLAASREFAENPPPADWDGRIVMTTK